LNFLREQVAAQNNIRAEACHFRLKYSALYLEQEKYYGNRADQRFGRTAGWIESSGQ